VPRGLLACVLVLSACARPGAVVVEPAGAPAAGQLRVVSYNVNFELAGDLEEILRVLPYWPRDRYLHQVAQWPGDARPGLGKLDFGHAPSCPTSCEVAKK
jgi:hypothetical protein